MRTLVLAIVAVGCGLVVSAETAAQPRRTIDVTRWLDAGPAIAPVATVELTRTPADPQPIVARDRWIFDLRWDSGDMWLLGVRVEVLPAPQPTPRAMGRFAVELYEGPALIERVRFDFPLLGAAEPDAGVSLSRKLRTSIGVYVPVTSRGTQLLLVDRSTSHRWKLPWPPRDLVDAAAATGKLEGSREAPPSSIEAGVSISTN